jgi:hypothetical protein
LTWWFFGGEGGWLDVVEHGTISTGTNRAVEPERNHREAKIYEIEEAGSTRASRGPSHTYSYIDKTSTIPLARARPPLVSVVRGPWPSRIQASDTEYHDRTLVLSFSYVSS